MHRNYFTLYHAAGELRSHLAGGYLFEIYSQQKNELTIAFIANDGSHIQLIVTTANPRLGLCVRKGLNRKKRNSAGLMTEICELEVIDVRMDTGDRIIHVLLQSDYRLELRLFTARTNVVLFKDGIEINSFKNQIPMPSVRFRPDVLKTLEHLALSRETFSSVLDAQAAGMPIKRLQTVLPGFDRYLVRELLKRAQGDDDHGKLHEAFRRLFFELIEPNPSIIIDITEGPFLSLLEHPDNEAKKYETVIDALSYYCSTTWQFLGAASRIRDLKQRINDALKKAHSMTAGVSADELEAAADRYSTMGHLLMANINADNPSGKSTTIVVDNFFDSETATMRIPIKPELDIRKNAERYFKKAAKTREQIKILRQQKEKVENIALHCTRLLEQAEMLKTPSDLRKFNETCAQELQAVGITGPRATAQRSLPFKTIPLPSGATLFLGKNARSNDILTFSFAKPHDIWLHARGSAGSHGILRGSSLQNSTDIERAAEIVAFHSAARHSAMVPVMYTEKKYIRKAASRLPGQVRLERERVIMVTPSGI